MPRGSRTVYFGTCSECGRRTCTFRLHRQKGQKSWKDFKRTVKYCPGCRKRTTAKLDEEKHSSG